MQSYVPLIHVNAGYLYLTPQSDPPAVTLKKKTLYKPRGRVAVSTIPYLRRVPSIHGCRLNGEPRSNNDGALESAIKL